MKFRQLLGPGLAVLGFAALSLAAPSCKAQEVNPDHFTSTGVETYPERGATGSSAASSKKAQAAPEVKQAKVTPPAARGRKATTPSDSSATLTPAAVRERKGVPSAPKKSTTPAPSH